MGEGSTLAPQNDPNESIGGGASDFWVDMAKIDRGGAGDCDRLCVEMCGRGNGGPKDFRNWSYKILEVLKN